MRLQANKNIDKIVIKYLRGMAIRYKFQILEAGLIEFYEGACNAKLFCLFAL